MKAPRKKKRNGRIQSPKMFQLIKSNERKQKNPRGKTGGDQGAKYRLKWKYKKSKRFGRKTKGGRFSTSEAKLRGYQGQGRVGDQCPKRKKTIGEEGKRELGGIPRQSLRENPSTQRRVPGLVRPGKRKTKKL